jgi:hypothetical protein
MIQFTLKNNNHDIITDNDSNDTDNECVTNETVSEDSPEEMVDINSQMDTHYVPCNSSYNLRPRKARDYGHLYLTVYDVCLTQYSLKKGLELFATEGAQEVEAELRQLHDCKVILPINQDTLSPHDREMALHYLIFL